MMRKVLLFICAMAVVLASCGPVTAVPSPTPTATARPKATNTPTPEPVSVGPNGDASSYQLRTWDEKDFWQLKYEMLPTYRVALDKEFLLKFPESKLRYEVLSDILANMPETTHVPGLPPQDDLMSWMITGMLESGVQLEDLQSEFKKSDLHVYESLSVNNLMGNGKDALVLGINTCQRECMMGIWAVFSDGEKYSVEKVRDWDYSQWPQIEYEIFDVGDTNGNGLSELIVLRSEKSGGSIYTALEDILEHIEWSQENGMFQRTLFPLIFQQCMLLDNIGAKPKSGIGTCTYDWKFTNNGSQSRLISHSSWYTQVGCPNLIVQRVSVWDGRRYVLGTPEILPPDGNLSSECRLAWADTAISLAIPGGEEEDLTQPGWENDQAISIIEQSLTNWPAKADEWWGTAGRDYFRLKLGIWRELRGERNQAISLLEQVANSPYDSRFDFASRLATLYLQERITEGSLKACDNLSDAFFQELFKVIPSPLSLNSPSSAGKSLKAMKNAWGFVPMDIELCDSLFMLPAEMKNHHLTSIEMLDSWLGTLSYPVYQSTPIDLNGDGLEDRLIFLERTDEGYLDGWAFFMTSDGFDARYFDEASIRQDHSDITIISLEVTDDVNAFMLPSDDFLSIVPVKRDLRIEYDAYAFVFGVQSYKVINQTPPVKIMVDVTTPDEEKTLIYSWDDFSQSFVEQNSLDVTWFQIEKLLYVDQNYPMVVDAIENLLFTSNFEPGVTKICGISVSGKCQYLPESYSAYFLYMHALAFEQMGQVDQARDAYYALWRDYPSNSFGIAASKKLIPVQP